VDLFWETVFDPLSGRPTRSSRRAAALRPPVKSPHAFAPAHPPDSARNILLPKFADSFSKFAILDSSQKKLLQKGGAASMGTDFAARPLAAGDWLMEISWARLSKIGS
jgi:hypothetical protein